MKHRVRTLIGHLNYAEMSKAGILPKLKLFTNKTVPSLGGRVMGPTLYKKLGASAYGILMEDIIEAQLNTISLDTVKSSLPVELQPSFHTKDFDALSVFIHQYFDNDPLQPQVEMEHGHIQGHPDFVSMDCVYDVKTTTRFGKMRVETILQLLSYYCLTQLNHMQHIQSVGLILPLQLQVVKVNLSTWNWKPFYQLLTACVPLKNNKESLWSMTLTESTAMRLLMRQFVGYHTTKDNVLQSISQLPAVQFFLNGNQTSSVNYKPQFLISPVE